MDIKEKASPSAATPGEATQENQVGQNDSTSQTNGSIDDGPSGCSAKAVMEPRSIRNSTNTIARRQWTLVTPKEYRSQKRGMNQLIGVPTEVGIGHKLPIDVIRDVVEQQFGSTSSIGLCAEVCVSAVCSLLLAEADGCLALIIEGPASSGKTTALNFLRGEALLEAGIVVPSDHFSPKSFVSQAANRKLEDLQRGDLLPRIRHSTLVVADLAPTLGGRQGDLREKIGILTRVLDGQGYESDGGSHGHRGYRPNEQGDYRFTLLAATTPLSRLAWDVMGSMGNRIVLLEAGSETVTTDDLVAAMSGKTNYQEKVQICAQAMSDSLLTLWDNSGGYGSIQWNQQEDDKELIEVIARVSQWVVKCRGSVLAEDKRGGEASLTRQIEDPHRLSNALYNLAKGHAIACGRRSLSQDDVALAVRVGLDSMPLWRRRTLKALLNGGEVTSIELQQTLNASRTTARDIMRNLEVLGAVKLWQGSKDVTTISLLDSEQWLQSEDLKWALTRLP